MGKRSRSKRRAKQNRYNNYFGQGPYQKWDAENRRYYWAAGRYDSKANNGRGAWVERPKNWAPTAPLYFAYGSNLNVKQMAQRSPEARPFSKLVLKDWKLVFRGVADIEPCAGASVQGGLWRITGADELALDRYEGVKGGLYGKHYFTVSYPDEAGQEVVEDVLVYIMACEDRREEAPWQHYLDTIRQGFKDFKLDETFLDEAVQAAPARIPKVYEYTGYGYTPGRSYGGEGVTYGKPRAGAWSRPLGHEAGEDHRRSPFDLMYPSKAERDAQAKAAAGIEPNEDDDAHAFWTEYERWLTGGGDGWSGGS